MTTWSSTLLLTKPRYLYVYVEQNICTHDPVKVASHEAYLLLLCKTCDFLSYIKSRVFPNSTYLGCWCEYVVPALSSTMAWSCFVYSVYTMTYDVRSLSVVVL